MTRLSGAARILGGLPVWAECWFTRGDWGDDDCGVDELYWLKRDGTKGALLPQSIIDRLDRTSPHWESAVCELVCDTCCAATQVEIPEAAFFELS